MSSSTSVPILLVAAGAVAVGHSVLPDHWVPLAVIARTSRWSILHTARISLLASIGHVVVSVGLGMIIAAIGLQFRNQIETQQARIVGTVLIATGLGFLVWSLTGHGHHHDDHGHDHDHPGPIEVVEESIMRRFAGIAVPFGAAASPDLTILPVFLAASAVGIGTAIGVLLVFSGVTLATFVGLTVIATIGGYQVEWPWLEEHGNLITALVLIAIGVVAFSNVI